jgi:hypothetical protein
MTLFVLAGCADPGPAAPPVEVGPSLPPSSTVEPVDRVGDRAAGREVVVEARAPVEATTHEVRVAGGPGRDLADALLLYDAANERDFDVNFCRLATFSGLACRRLDLSGASLTDEVLRDGAGDYYPLVGISGQVLEDPLLLTPQELSELGRAVQEEGTHLLVSALIDEVNVSYPRLQTLTEGAFLGVTTPADGRADWFVSDHMTATTGVFSGQVISCGQIAQPDGALVWDATVSLTHLITSVNDSGAAYPIMTQVPSGAGSIFANTGDPYGNLNQSVMRNLEDAGLYEPCTFSKLVPLMFAFRFALGEEMWSAPRAFANLTIDDPPLQDNYLGLEYAALVAHMQAHDFHTTIAFIPKNYNRTDSVVARLFLTRPDHLSLVQHGNNSDGYEFYKYDVEIDDPHPARPIADQRVDVVEGMARMAELRRRTGIPSAPVMVFPAGAFTEPALVWLKANNFNATVNDDPVPLDRRLVERFDFGMYPAIMEYGSFASVDRWAVGSAGLDAGTRQWLLFDLFVGKPALLFSHADEVFKHGEDGFNTSADWLNALPLSLEWRSLGYVMQRLMLHKRADDGSVDVMWFGNHLTLENATDEAQIYHLRKQDALNVPIASVTVNGTRIPFRVEAGWLLFDLAIPAGGVAEVRVTYEP